MFTSVFFLVRAPVCLYVLPMAPPGRTRGLVDAIQQTLAAERAAAAAAARAPRGGLGGGFRLQQGRRIVPPPPLPPRPAVRTPEDRAPLYPASRRNDAGSTLENVMQRRLVLQPNSLYDEAALRRQMQMRATSWMLHQGGDLTGALPRIAAAGGFIDEINTVHENLSRHTNINGGLTTAFMQRVGGTGSKIDYNQLAQQRRRHGVGPRLMEPRFH